MNNVQLFASKQHAVLFVCKMNILEECSVFDDFYKNYCKFLIKNKYHGAALAERTFSHLIASDSIISPFKAIEISLQEIRYIKESNIKLENIDFNKANLREIKSNLLKFFSKVSGSIGNSLRSNHRAREITTQIKRLEKWIDEFIVLEDELDEFYNLQNKSNKRQKTNHFIEETKQPTKKIEKGEYYNRYITLDQISIIIEKLLPLPEKEETFISNDIRNFRYICKSFYKLCDEVIKNKIRKHFPCWKPTNILYDYELLFYIISKKMKSDNFLACIELSTNQTKILSKFLNISNIYKDTRMIQFKLQGNTFQAISCRKPLPDSTSDEIAHIELKNIQKYVYSEEFESNGLGFVTYDHLNRRYQSNTWNITDKFNCKRYLFIYKKAPQNMNILWFDEKITTFHNLTKGQHLHQRTVMDIRLGIQTIYIPFDHTWPIHTIDYAALKIIKQIIKGDLIIKDGVLSKGINVNQKDTKLNFMQHGSLFISNLISILSRIKHDCEITFQMTNAQFVICLQNEEYMITIKSVNF